MLWDDLNPSAGGEIYYETVGAAPNRRFIALWDGVPQFADTDSNTFQAVLHEGSNRIEFRYGLISPQAFDGDFTMGIENIDGTVGQAHDPDWPLAGDLTLGYTQDPANDPCNNGADCTSQGAAPGDEGYGRRDGKVTAADLNYFINAWISLDTPVADVTTQGANPNEAAYSAEDGQVTAADLNYFVNQWVKGTP